VLRYLPIQQLTPPCRLHAPLPVAVLLVPSLQIAPTRVVPVLPGHHGMPPGGLGGCDGVVGCGVMVGCGVGVSVEAGGTIDVGDALGAGVASRRTIGKYTTGAPPSAFAGHAAVTIILAQKITSAKRETIRFTTTPDSVYVNPKPAGFVQLKWMPFTNQSKQIKHLWFTREPCEREF